jgi:hypothetical protein
MIWVVFLRLTFGYLTLSSQKSNRSSGNKLQALVGLPPALVIMVNFASPPAKDVEYALSGLGFLRVFLFGSYNGR